MVQESGLFQRTDPVPGLGQAPQVANEAFTLADGAVSGALVSPRGVVFVTVASKKDAYIPMLDEVKERVREDTIRARATELSRQRAAAVAAALKSAPDFAAAAKAQGLESKDTELIAREAAAARHRREHAGGQGGLRAAGRRRQRSDRDRQGHGDREGGASATT